MKKRILPPSDVRPPLPDFTPVPRAKCRHDGWTPERQHAFIKALAETGSVTVAARMVNMSWNSAYQLRNHPQAGEFRRAWEAAQGLGVQRLKDEAFDRAMNGQLVPVFSNGKLMGYRRQKNDRLLMFYLDRFGQDNNGRTVTINRFEAHAHASAVASHGGDAKAAAVAVVEQSTEARTGEPSDGTAIADEAHAAVVANFVGVALDAQAQADVQRALAECAARQRALTAPDDPEQYFVTDREVQLSECERPIFVPLGHEATPFAEGEEGWHNLDQPDRSAEIEAAIQKYKALEASGEAAEKREARAKRLAAAPRDEEGNVSLDWRDYK